MSVACPGFTEEGADAANVLLHDTYYTVGADDRRSAVGALGRRARRTPSVTPRQDWRVMGDRLLSKNAARIRRCRTRMKAGGLVRFEGAVWPDDRALLADLIGRLRNAPEDHEFRDRLRRMLGAGFGDENTRAGYDGVPARFSATPLDSGNSGQSPRDGRRSGGRHEGDAMERRGAVERRRGSVEGAAAGQPPSTDQMNFARRIAERRGLSVPDGLDRAEMSAWINANR